MTKLPAIKPRKLISILGKLGFKEFPGKGSHRIFVKEDIQIVVPFHSRDMKKGTLRQIIKTIGMTGDEFKDLF